MVAYADGDDNYIYIYIYLYTMQSKMVYVTLEGLKKGPEEGGVMLWVDFFKPDSH